MFCECHSVNPAGLCDSLLYEMCFLCDSDCIYSHINFLCCMRQLMLTTVFIVLRQANILLNLEYI